MAWLIHMMDGVLATHKPGDMVFFDGKTIGVLNENNYPFSLGRHLTTGHPDDNEFIIIKLDKPLGK